MQSYLLWWPFVNKGAAKNSFLTEKLIQLSFWEPDLVLELQSEGKEKLHLTLMYRFTLIFFTSLQELTRELKISFRVKVTI